MDADALGLHDYHDIIKQPMDMGLIKVSVCSTSVGLSFDDLGVTGSHFTFNDIILVTGSASLLNFFASVCW